METTQLYNSLTFLSYATGIIVIFVGIMLVKVLYDISKLTRNIDETTTIVKTELEPTLKNVNRSVEIVSGIIIKTNENVEKVKKFVSNTPLKLIGQLSKLAGKASQGFWTGLCSAIKIFASKK
jgi:predicted PurR-regulated permease PerM